MLPILLINHYDSYAHLLKGLIWKITGCEPKVVFADDPWFKSSEWKKFEVIILSPGPGTVENDADFGYSRHILEKSKNPVLGICLGMQGIAYSTGAKIKRSSPIFHGKSSLIVHDHHPLFKGIPSLFKAVRYHSLVVDRKTLNPALKILAHSQGDGEIMAICHRDKPFYGLQFHPESIGTEYGEKVIQNFFEIQNLTQYFKKDLFKKEPFLKNFNHFSGSSNQSMLTKSSSLSDNMERELPWVSNPLVVWKKISETMPYCFWLDSNQRSAPLFLNKQNHQFSYMGFSSCVWSLKKGQWTKKEEKNHWKKQKCALKSLKEFFQERQNLVSKKTMNVDSFPFKGGVVGAMNYASDLEDLELNHNSLWMEATEFFVWDHQKEKFFHYSFSVKNRLLDVLKSVSFGKSMDTFTSKGKNNRELKDLDFWEKQKDISSLLSKKDYEERFLKIQDYLKQGQIYQMCLTNQWIYRFKKVDYFKLYANLRENIKASYSACLKTPTGCFMSVSPELFLRVFSDGTILTEPMKGSKKVKNQKFLAEEKRIFLKSPKENAELLMITDLLRNDFSKVCNPFSIETNSLKIMSEWSSVLQLSSQIKGKLQEGISFATLLKAVFPSGSITGAPKLRSTTLIKILEASNRKNYTGNIGFVGNDGEACLNVAIRSLWVTSTQATLGAGGAITIESTFESEYNEMWFKAIPLLNILYQSVERIKN